MSKLRVGLVDDHPIVLAGLVDLIGQELNYEVVGVGKTSENAVELAMRHKPDLIVMDLNMPGDVLSAIKEITEMRIGTKVLVFTASDKIEDCHKVLAVGANGYVVKGSSGDDLFHAMRSVISGDQFISSSLSIRMLQSIHAPKPEKSVPNQRKETELSYREDQIVRHLMLGASNRQIAESLNISEKTVKYYMTQIMQKVDAKNRVEVVINLGKRKGFFSETSLGSARH